MACTRRWEDKLLSQALSEGPVESAEEVRRHLESCPACQGAWRQWDDLRHAAGELRAAPPPGGLREAVVARLVTGESATSRTAHRPRLRWRLRTVLALAAAALLLCGAVMVLAGPQILLLHGGATGFQLDGHSWSVASSHPGEVTLRNAKGQDLGHKLGPNWVPFGPKQVRVKIDGAQHVFRKLGVHEVRDSAGQLLGYVVIRDVPGPSPLEALKLTHRPVEESGGSTGVQVNRREGVIRGFHRGLDLTFEVHGQATVTLTPLRGAPVTQGSLTEGGKEAQTPTTSWTIAGHTEQRQGFGSYEVKGADGSPVATLDVAPTAAR